MVNIAIKLVIEGQRGGRGMGRDGERNGDNEWSQDQWDLLKEQSTSRGLALDVFQSADAIADERRHGLNNSCYSALELAFSKLRGQVWRQSHYNSL